MGSLRIKNQSRCLHFTVFLRPMYKCLCLGRPTKHAFWHLCRAPLPALPVFPILSFITNWLLLSGGLCALLFQCKVDGNFIVVHLKVEIYLKTKTTQLQSTHFSRLIAARKQQCSYVEIIVCAYTQINYLMRAVYVCQVCCFPKCAQYCPQHIWLCWNLLEN